MVRFNTISNINRSAALTSMKRNNSFNLAISTIPFLEKGSILSRFGDQKENLACSVFEVASSEPSFSIFFNCDFRHFFIFGDFTRFYYISKSILSKYSKFSSLSNKVNLERFFNISLILDPIYSGF